MLINSVNWNVQEDDYKHYFLKFSLEFGIIYTITL